MRLRILLASMLFLACREAPPAEAPAPTPSPPLVVGSSDAGAPPAAHVEDAGASKPRIPAALVHLVDPKDRLLLGPFAWPPKGTSLFAGQLSVAFVWKSEAAEQSEMMPTDHTPVRAIIEDVDGDGTTELVTFLAPRRESPADYEDHATVWIFGERANDHRVSRMRALEYQIIGATDEKSLHTELAARNALGPTAGVPIERIIARLELATPDELRALLPAAGVRVCHRQARRRSCTTTSRAAITARKILETTGGFAQYEADGFVGLQVPACDTKSSGGTTTITCLASIGGPSGAQWVFERKGTTLELVEIGTWAEDS